MQDSQERLRRLAHVAARYYLETGSRVTSPRN